MDRLIGWIERYGVIPLPERPDERRAALRDIVAGYRDDLSDLPDDLLLAAVERTVRAHKYRTLPMPADIRQHADSAMRERTTLLNRLRTAEMIARRTRRGFAAKPATEAEKNRVAAVLADFRAGSNPAGAHASAHADDAAAKPDRLDAVRRVMAEASGFRRVPMPGEGDG